MLAQAAGPLFSIQMQPDTAIDVSGKNEQIIKVFWTQFIAVARLVMARVHGSGYCSGMILNVPDKSAVFAFFTFELQRGMEYPVLLQPFLDLLFYLFNLFHIPFAGIHMRIEHVDIRTETPEMDMMHAVHPFHGGHVSNDRIEIHRLRRELEKYHDRLTEYPDS